MCRNRTKCLRWFLCLRVNYKSAQVSTKLRILSLISAASLLVFLSVFLDTADALGQVKTQGVSPYRPHDVLNDAGFNSFYNLDFDRAVSNFEKVAQKYPEDPFAANHVLTAVLFRELYRMGALNSGEYANDSFVNAPHHAADPKVKVQIKNLVEQAQRLEQKRLDANSKDVDALYARGVTRAQYATYTALIEHA